MWMRMICIDTLTILHLDFYRKYGRPISRCYAVALSSLPFDTLK